MFTARAFDHDVNSRIHSVIIGNLGGPRTSRGGRWGTYTSSITFSSPTRQDKFDVTKVYR